MFDEVKDEQLESWFDEYQEKAQKMHQIAVDTANSGGPDSMLYYRKYSDEANEWSKKAGAIVTEMRKRGHKLFPNG